MTTTNATATHDFAIYNVDANDFTFVSIDEGDGYGDVVHASCDGDMFDGFLCVTILRDMYASAKAEGRLLSTEAAQSVIDGDASLVRLTQRGRSFYRSVTGSPFRYAEGCMKRAGVKTGYDVLLSNA